MVGRHLRVLPRPTVAPQGDARRPSFTKVVGAVWAPGVGLAFSSVGFGAVTTFVVLLFAQRGWGLAWLALTVFATGFVLARVLFGHLADRIGGAKVALVSALVEAVGLVLVWLAPWGAVAGFGYSLVYPGFGVEAVRRAPAESRGLAMGAYTAFPDLALGLANPALGLLAGGFGLGTVFLASALAVACSAFVAARLLLWSVKN